MGFGCDKEAFIYLGDQTNMHTGVLKENKVDLLSIIKGV
jgi:hypothetical protein